jgi:hypothetical protein
MAKQYKKRAELFKELVPKEIFLFKLKNKFKKGRRRKKEVEEKIEKKKKKMGEEKKGKKSG